MRKFGVLLAIGVVGTAVSSSANDLTPCNGLAESDAASCRSALELLNEESAFSPELRVLATGHPVGWLIRYDRLPEMEDPNGKSRCALLANSLVLPKGELVRLSFTSQDEIRELNIPELGVDETALPGRVSEVILNKPELLSTQQDRASRKADGSINPTEISVRLLEPDVYDAWERETLGEKCELVE